MTLLAAHLEQISLCAQTVAELPFQPPKIFVNALITSHDITALIRDTEPHERALFSVQPLTTPPNAQDPALSTSRRSTVFDVNQPINTRSKGSQYPLRTPRRATAASLLLGGGLPEHVRQGDRTKLGNRAGDRTAHGRDKSEVDVNTLLQGAEKLCGVYPILGAEDKVATLRNRYKQVKSSIDHYEAQVAQQTAQLNKMNRPSAFHQNMDVEDMNAEEFQQVPAEDYVTTKADLRKEEEDIRELERKKQALESRVSGMERDLGGLLR